MLSFALYAYGFAFRDDRSRPRAGRLAPGPGDRSRQRQPLHRTQSGDRPGPRSRPKHGDNASAFDHLSLAIRNYARLGQHHYDAHPPGCPRRACSTGSDATKRRPPSPVSRFSPLTAPAVPEISTAITHLRDVLGDQTYESLARKGETMTTAEMVDVRIRPNRPGPSRTERRLEIDEL